MSITCRWPHVQTPQGYGNASHLSVACARQCYVATQCHAMEAARADVAQRGWYCLHDHIDQVRSKALESNQALQEEHIPQQETV